MSICMWNLRAFPTMHPVFTDPLSATKEKGARRAKDRDPALIGGGRKSGKAPLRMQQVSLDLRNEYKRAGWGLVISCMKRVASPGSMHDTGCAAAVTAAPLLRSRLAEDALSSAGPRRRLSHHRAGAHPQGRKQSINLPGRFLHPPPQTCLSPAPHSQGGPGHTPLTVPKPRSLCWAQHRISIRELTGRQSWQMGSLPAVQTQSISPPGSPVPGILQARTLEWVAIS